MKFVFSFLFLAFHVLVSAQQKWDIRFYTETENREIFIYADNDEPMPMSAQFNFKLVNLKNTLRDDEIVVVPAETKKFLIAKLSPIVLNAGNQFSYSNSYNFGDASQTTYDEDYVYSLPFEKGKTQLIFQGYNGKFSHSGEFSLDFNLKIGEPVMAAREGVVSEVTDHNTKNCPSLSCAKFNNRILIMHSDGTFADYAHLKYKGITVKKGDLVKKGQLIGYSGNTGYSSGPHLHFAVFLNRIDGKRIFIKTKFQTSAGVQILQEGKSYTKNY